MVRSLNFGNGTISTCNIDFLLEEKFVFSFESVYDRSRMDLLPMSGMCSTTPVTYLVLVLSGILSSTQLKGLLLLEHLPDQPSTPYPPNSRITPSSCHVP